MRTSTAMRIVTIIVSLGAVAIAEAAAISLHAASLSPTLALLTWSAPAPSSWLSLSLDRRPALSSLSLPPSAPSHLLVRGALDDAEAASAAEFTLCERHHSDQRSPLCAHATPSAPLSSSSAAAMDGRAHSPWDLSGAVLSAEVIRSTHSASSHRFIWSASSVSADPTSPPLLYSLFAEWTAPTVDATTLRNPAGATHTTAATQTTLQRHTMRICSTQSDAQQTQLHCDVPAERLPPGVELTLHLLTDCDYRRIDAEGAASLPHCMSAVSPEVRVTLLTEVVFPAAPPPVSFTAMPGVAQVANDTAVREALCTFFHQTSGPQWNMHSGWCDPVAPICRNGSHPGWFGVGCDSSGQVVTSLFLADNLLVSPSTGIDISPLFDVVNQLRELSLSTNKGLHLSRLSLAPLSKLTNLALANIALSLLVTQPLLLPSPVCALSVISLVYTSFSVQDWSACRQLTLVDVGSLHAPLSFAIVTLLPSLQQFLASGSTLTCDAVVPGGLSGGELTLFILSHLNESNPLLQQLDISDSSLPFGLANSSSDNWPHINAPLLQSLAIDSLPLRTGPMGPVDNFWLRDLPSLIVLEMSGLSAATVHTAAFLYAASTLQSWSCNSRIVGNLDPLYSLSSLTQIDVSGSGLRSELPTNVSFVWPQLSIFRCSGCALYGRLPDFRGLPSLLQLYLDGNTLVGPIGLDFASDSLNLNIVLLSSNLLQSPLPSFCGSPTLLHAAFDSNLIAEFPSSLSCYGSLNSLQLQNNPLQGQLPSTLWSQLPMMKSLVLSHTLLTGSIPDRDPSLPTMQEFLADGCQFSGRLPRNIDTYLLDLSNNNFSSSLILFDERYQGITLMQTLRLTSAGRLTCPISLSALFQLQTLVIAGNSFDQCDWTNVTLPRGLEQIDISDNNWREFDLSLPQSSVYVRAARANVQGLAMVTGAASNPLQYLSEITLDGNILAPTNSAGYSVFQQLSYLLGEMEVLVLRSFSCQGCGLSFAIGPLMPILAHNDLLEVVRLSDNQIWSEFPTLSGFETLELTFPARCTEFSIARNPGIRGRLPSVDAVFQNLAQIDFSGTGLTGAVPSSWTNLPALNQLNLANTSVQCHLVITANQQLQCDVQSATILAPSRTTAIEFDSLADPSAGVHCSALTIAATGSSAVTADPSFHGFTLCSCDPASFGLHARCYRCPDGCTCIKDTIQNCFPIVQRGSIAVTTQIGIGGERPVIADSVMPFTITAVLPCPRTVTGEPLCNPGSIPWPSFYRIVETAEGGSVSAVLAGSVSSSASEIDFSAWCSSGHSGRLCAACSSGYFSSGRWCLRCLSEGVHVLILTANLLLIIALIAYLYAKSPTAVDAAKGLRLYVSRLVRSAGLVPSAQSMLDLSLGSAVHAASSFSASSSFSSSAAGSPSSEAANPLKLLIFHSQQLSLLLHTSTSLPPVMAGLLSFLNSGSTGFSLSSLVAMECLRSWTLRERCWMTVFAPLLIGLFAALTALFGRQRGSRANGGRAMHLQGRDEPLLTADSEADAPSSPSRVPRIYSVCVSLLYFLFFPCAQTVLSAVACTDRGESDHSFLNLFPDQACDDEWRRSILPPAVIGLLLWIVAFPLGSTLVLMRLRKRVTADSASEPRSASALSVWPVCSDLLLPYSPRFWFWEQLLLLRRLLLVAAVTIIPTASLYLPLVLFAIIQLSALQQHRAAPYAHPLLNAGELASLYLLLISYISAIILQTGLTEGGFHATADGWAAALFVVNGAFLLVLVAGLFGWARQWLSAHWIASKRSVRSASLR